MWNRLKEVERHFTYRYPSIYGDAVQMTWLSLAKKVPEIHLQVNKWRRYSRQDQFKEALTSAAEQEEEKAAVPPPTVKRENVEESQQEFTKQRQ